MRALSSYLFFFSTVLLLPSVSALTFTSPTSTSILSWRINNTVTWTTDSSDPVTFELFYIATGPQWTYNTTIGLDVTTSNERYVVASSSMTDGDVCWLEAWDTDTSALLGRSENFTVNDNGVRSASSTSSVVSAINTRAATASLTMITMSAAAATYTSGAATASASSTYVPSSSSSSSYSSPPSLPTGAIAAIAIGAFVIFALLCFYVFRHHEKRIAAAKFRAEQQQQGQSQQLPMQQAWYMNQNRQGHNDDYQPKPWEVGNGRANAELAGSGDGVGTYHEMESPTSPSDANELPAYGDIVHELPAYRAGDGDGNMRR